jgi:hypothetical protein
LNECFWSFWKNEFLELKKAKLEKCCAKISAKNDKIGWIFNSEIQNMYHGCLMLWEHNYLVSRRIQNWVHFCFGINKLHTNIVIFVRKHQKHIIFAWFCGNAAFWLHTRLKIEPIFNSVCTNYSEKRQILIRKHWKHIFLLKLTRKQLLAYETTKTTRKNDEFCSGNTKNVLFLWEHNIFGFTCE